MAISQLTELVYNICTPTRSNYLLWALERMVSSCKWLQW